MPAPGVLANDIDAEGQALTATLVAGTSHGSPDVQRRRQLHLYAGAGTTTAPTASPTGRATGRRDSGVVTVTITVNAVNDVPVATADSFSTAEDTPLVVDGPGVIGNDTDADGDSLTAVLVRGPRHGTLALNADGSFSYTPAANYNGADSFTYQVNDGTADSNVVTVAIAISAVVDAPMAVDNSYSKNEDISVERRGARRAGERSVTATTPRR